MSNIKNILQSYLDKRKDENALRKLNNNFNRIDFSSNDYLGFAKSQDIFIKTETCSKKNIQNGSTGSRLITGNSELFEETEQFIANYHDAETGLIFNSGYSANIGVFSSIPQKGDTIIYDEFVHASIRDGIRLSFANSFSFIHNDIENLEKKLKLSKGNIFIAIESIYSMDGDFCPLAEIVFLAEKYNANIIIDEAHSNGIIGKKGKGLACDLNLQNKIFARIHTFGKAIGSHGAIVLGSKTLKSYLINFSRPFIYTTALPSHNLFVIQNAYKKLGESEKLIEQLFYNILIFRTLINYDTNNLSPINSIIFKGNDKVKEVASIIQKEGLDVRPILSPTVPKGTERLRVCIHSYNKKEEIIFLSQLINNLRDE